MLLLFRLSGWLHVVAGLLVIFAGHSAADDPLPAREIAHAERAKPAVDRCGDPLPGGARSRLGTVRFRHSDAVYFVGFAGLGKQLVTASRDNRVHVWERATGKELHRIKLDGKRLERRRSTANQDVFDLSCHTGGLLCRVMLSPDGQTLAAISWKDNIVQLWEVATGKKLRPFATKGSYYAAFCFSPDGKQLVVSDHGSTWLFDVATGKEPRLLAKQPDHVVRLRSPGLIGAPVVFAPDGKTVALLSWESDDNDRGNDHAVVEIIEVESGKQLRCINGPQGANYFTSVTYAPDGKSLVLGGTNILAYDPVSGKNRWQIKPRNYDGKGRLAVSPDSRALVLKWHGAAATVHDLGTGKQLRKLGDGSGALGDGCVDDERAAAQDIAFSPDGKYVAMASLEGAARLWEFESGKEVGSEGSHLAPVTAVSVSTDRKTLTTLATDSTLRQWDSLTGKELRVVKLPARARNFHFSSDGRLVVFGTTSNRLNLWDVVAGKELCAFDVSRMPPHFDRLVAGAGGLAFSADAKQLAVRDFEGQVRLFDTGTCKETTTFSVRNPNPDQSSLIIVNGVSPGIAFSPDGRTVAAVTTIDDVYERDAAGFNVSVVNGSNLVRLWNATSGRHLAQFHSRKIYVHALTFAPDGRCLATANADQTVTVYETATGKERGQLLIDKREDGSSDTNAVTLRCLVFSPDGRFVAAGGSDGKVHMWELRTGKKLVDFFGHRGAVRCLAFSLDSKTLATGSADTTALVYDTTPYLPADAATVELTNDELEARWTELAGDDAGKAFQATELLGRCARQSVPLLGEGIQPAAVDRQKVEQLLADLESKQFLVRQKASAELQKLDELVEPDLRKMLEARPTLEVRQRIDRILERLVSSQPPPLPRELVRALRALEVLEHIGTVEAKAVLTKLASGAEGARLTREAKAALDRVTARLIRARAQP
jgi:WD40 repeat protein